jgi:RNA polymerase sigma-70 factor (ECF subfamily)
VTPLLTLAPAGRASATAGASAVATGPTPAASLPGEDERVARARAGDLSAFGELVRQHQRAVFGVALRMLGDRPAAEELAQDVFVQLHRHLASIESAAHLRFWLRRVTAHRAIDRARQRARAAELPLEAVAEQPAAGGDADPLLARQLREALGGLTPPARAVVVLRYQQDLDPTDIAEALDMPLNTVKSHLRRSLAVLRERCARLRGTAWEQDEERRGGAGR